MRVLISPFSSTLRNGNINAKNYPLTYWKEVISFLQEGNHTVIQIGTKGEEVLVPDCFHSLPMNSLEELILSVDTFISVDNFLPHMAAFLSKSGIVLWGVSDPEIFGYPIHINLLKDRINLRYNQFDMWEGVPYREDVFVSPFTVIEQIKIFNNVNSATKTA